MTMTVFISIIVSMRRTSVPRATVYDIFFFFIDFTRAVVVAVKIMRLS